MNNEELNEFAESLEEPKPITPVDQDPTLPAVDDTLDDWADPTYEMPAKYAADPQNTAGERRDWSYHQAKGDMTRREWNSGAFQTNKGTIDNLGGFAEDPKTTWEGAAALPTGIADAAIGTYNMLTPGPDIPYIPQFENEGAQFIRDMSSIILPGAGWANGLRRGGSLVAALSTGKTSRFLTNPLTQKAGNFAATLTGGGLGDLFAPVQGDPEGQTLIGAAKETFPRWMGFLPDNLVIQDGDSPDTVRAKNVTEGAIFQAGGSFLAGIGKLWRGLKGVDTATTYIPKNEKASEYFAKNQPSNPATADEVVNNSALRGDEELAEIGEFNLQNAIRDGVDVDGATIFGKDIDLFDVGENVVRSTDEMGIVGMAVDQTRIAKNIDTAYGRIRNPMSEAALKFTLETGQAPRIISQLGDSLGKAGKYDVSLPSGKTVSSKQIAEEVENLTANMLGMDKKQLQRVLKDMISMKEGLPALDKISTRAVARTLNESLSQLGELGKIDNIKALALTEASFAGQASDFAQSLRLQDGTIGQFRAMEQLLDRLEFLQDLRGMSAMAKRGINQTRNTWARLTGSGAAKGDVKYAEELSKRMQGDMNTTLEAIEIVQADTRQFMQSLRALNAERPNFLKPMATIYELTDGDARSVAAANNYLRNKFGVIKKAFVDGEPEIPSVVMQGWWSTMFNSALSGLKTPLKAGISNLSTWVVKPTTEIAGAYLNGGKGPELTRAMYAYGSVMDTMQKGNDYMKTMWVRSSQDPDILRARDELVYKTSDDLKLAKEFAESAAKEGNDGPMALYEIMKTQDELAKHPLLRIGNRSMGAQDAWLRSITAQQIARLRAFDILTENGTKALDKDAGNKLAKKIYESMFDSNGVIKDEQVLREAGRQTFSNDNALSTGFQQLMQRIPGLKPFFMFTRTPVNMVSYGAEMNPVGAFTNKVNRFGAEFESLPAEKVKKLLTAEGVDIDTIPSPEAEYNRLRNMYRGASAVGASMVMMGIYGYFSGNITGRVGLRDRKKQAARREFDWKPMKAFGVDYSQIPGVSDWLSMTIDILDNSMEMEQKDVGELLRTMGYILGANFTERTQLGNIEQFNDVLSGNPAAIQRWAANITATSQFKVAGALGTLNQIISPQLAAVEQRMDQMLLNRVPGKPTLTNKADWIDGGYVGISKNPLVNLYNAVSPLPYHEAPSEVKEYLIKVEFDALPPMSSRSDGVPYTQPELEQIREIMGKDGDFRKGMADIMREHPISSIKQSFAESQAAGLAPSVKDVDKVHTKIHFLLQQSKLKAEAQLPDLQSSIKQRADIKEGQKYYTREGDAVGGKAFMDSMQQQSY